MDDKKTLMFHGGQAIGSGGPQAPHAPHAPHAPTTAPNQQPWSGAPAMHGQGPQPMHGQPGQPVQGPPPSAPLQSPPQPAPMQNQWQQQQRQQHQHQQQQHAQQQRPQQPHGQQGHGQHGHGQQGKAPWSNFASGGGMASMGANMSRKKIIMAVVGAIALAIVSTVGLVVKNKFTGGKTGKNTISYSQLGINKKSANVDELIGSLESRARKWKRDASWWGLSIYGVKPDGTVDFTANNGGGAKVKFVSASGVQSAAKRVRRDSIKEYSMTPKGARDSKIIGAKKPWKNFKAIGIPSCKVNDLTAALRERGFGEGTVRIGFDTKFAFASGWAWRVQGKDKNKKLSGFYSMNDCSFVKALPGG